MTNIEVYPLFSSPVGVIDIEKNLFDKQFIKSHFNYELCNSPGSVNSFATSESLDVLNVNGQKNALLNYFNTYKNNFLKLHSTNFQIVSAWFTKTLPGGYSQFHNHQNSVYSAVYYFDDYDDDSGKLEFESYGILPNQILLNDPVEWGPYNSRSWAYKPMSNKMIIFPSYLYHRVTENKSSLTRYSMALNFFPIGKFGVGDSNINLMVM
jgi:hypothetical protein